MNMFRKRLLHGTSFNVDKLKTRPLIAIANSHTELTTDHSHLDRLARKVHDGILAAGGESADFNAPVPRPAGSAGLPFKTWCSPFPSIRAFPWPRPATRPRARVR
ncbi:hypothetical protein EJI01_27320 [Variovorax sp. MHTC-1]|nr:hypothetical protein EJI01_27320 [Variovorax sp. MHTC-1]